MKRVIVDYSKLTNEILNLLVDKFPEGYDDTNIVRFRNAQNEMVEAVEVRTEDTIYLVKVSTKLANSMENFDEDDDIDSLVEPLDDIVKGIDEDDDMADDEEEDDEELIKKTRKRDQDDDDATDDDDEDQDFAEEDEDEDEE
ncbi:DNA primase [Flavobacterium ardleyense]|uniref:DNA primase n=1 Tax=Flavobacterium ardleyense TaxID=2038737 RepID=UPI00298C29D4|nr:DNA primase [Flavobacterium ardleyense]